MIQAPGEMCWFESYVVCRSRVSRVFSYDVLVSTPKIDDSNYDDVAKSPKRGTRGAANGSRRFCVLSLARFRCSEISFRQTQIMANTNR